MLSFIDSLFIHASIKTSPVSCCCAIAGIKFLSSNFSASITSSKANMVLAGSDSQDLNCSVLDIVIFDFVDGLLFYHVTKTAYIDLQFFYIVRLHLVCVRCHARIVI